MSLQTEYKTVTGSPTALGDRTYEYIVSTGDLDRDKDRIRAAGWDLSEYRAIR